MCVLLAVAVRIDYVSQVVLRSPSVSSFPVNERERQAKIRGGSEKEGNVSRRTQVRCDTTFF